MTLAAIPRGAPVLGCGRAVASPSPHTDGSSPVDVWLCLPRALPADPQGRDTSVTCRTGFFPTWSELPASFLCDWKRISGLAGLFHAQRVFLGLGFLFSAPP